MASSGNFMTFNRLAWLNSSYSATYTKIDRGNLQGYATAGGWGWPSNFTFDSGKWYVEFYIYVRSESGRGYIGVVDHYFPNIAAKYNDNRHRQPTIQDYTVYYIGAFDGSNAAIVNNVANGTSASQTFSGIWADGDKIGVALDLDSGTQTVKFYKNGSAVGNAETLNASASGNWAFWSGSHNACWHTMNAGQDSSFCGRATAQGNADDSGFGDFYYSPPSGYLAPSSANLPISADIDGAVTDDDIGEKQCATLLYTGTGSSNAVTGLGFKPDLVIIKNRAGTQGTKLTDSSRGVTKVLQPAGNSAESTDSGGLTAFGTDGFTVGDDAGYNGSTNNMVAHCWKANGGTTATNTDGSITSTVQANTKAGFSIVEFTGINSATTATVGHGLGKAPTFIIHKSVNTSAWHLVRGVPGMPVSYVRDLNPNGSPTDVSGNGGALVAPTSSVFNINNTTGIGGGGYTYVAYCWAPIEGYSKFGSYTGNGESDGPFIYTGFRPQIVLFMGYAYGIENFIFDNKRNTSNPITTYVRWGRSSAEGSHTHCDFLANGFKIRNTGGDYNGSTGLFMYMAWGDVPFKYNNTH